MMKALFLCVIWVLLVSSEARPWGAQPGACDSMIPGHGVASQQGTGGYYLYSDLIDNGGSYEANTDYTIRLEHASGDTFLGFLIQSRIPYTTTRLGTFTNLPDNTQYLNCSGNEQASVTHTDADPKSSVTFTWRSPSTAGTVDFRYTVVSTAYTTFYANINAIINRPPSSNCPTTDKTPSSSFPNIFRSPTGCDREDCTFYWAVGPNSADSNYIDVYMEGDTQGWMALGFSDDQLMSNTDVLGCRLYSDNSSVEVMGGWNPTPNYTPNQRDQTQDGICTHSTSYTNGRISCLFSRATAITNVGQDLDLDNELWIIRAFRNESQPDSFRFLFKHTETPLFSSERINPRASDDDDDGAGITTLSVLLMMLCLVVGYYTML